MALLLNIVLRLRIFQCSLALLWPGDCLLCTAIVLFNHQLFAMETTLAVYLPLADTGHSPVECVAPQLIIDYLF
jgi:hypothetical protein